MTNLSLWKKAGAVFVFCAVIAIVSSAQMFTTLGSFDKTDGFYPEATLVQGTDGNLYGTAIWGGNLPCYSGTGCGTVFRITPKGKLTTLYTFCTQPNCADGAEPYAGLVLATNGNFYGTTFAGGSGGCSDGVIPGCGTVFKITPKGKLTTLYNICTQPDCSDGAEPFGALLQAANGRFYGTTQNGGTHGCGTVFEITDKGKFGTLHSFNETEGCSPASREALVQATHGDFYGTTVAGGANGHGTVFKIAPGGAVTRLHSFCAKPNCADGDDPLSGLILATNGNFYGTTFVGGTRDAGTIFEISPEGKLTTLYSFCAQLPNCTDGAIPYGRVIQATNGNVYGTTYSNGANGGGTIFEITPAGTLTTLYDFCDQNNCTDGASPEAGLLQSTKGKFYGTTCCGGANGFGAIFSLDVGLSPFVAFVRGYGRVGRPFGILGQRFTGTTSVSLNGIPASFTVVSDTFITATVPPGATTGYVTVATPTGTLKSNVPFHVIR